MEPWLIQLIAIQFAFFAFIIWIIARHRSETARRRTEERMRLFDRFESKEDLEAFLDSSSGKNYLDTAGQRPSDPRRAILVSVAVGIISLVVGSGLFFLDAPPQNEDGMLVPATIMAAAGFGILIAAAVSVVLVRLWGLDNGRSVENGKSAKS